MKIEIRNATDADAEFLFSLANDPQARRNSFNPKPIKWSEHKIWLSEKINSPNSYIYIFSVSNQLVGTVKLDKTTKTVIGVTVSPDFRGQGLGRQIIKIGCDTFWETNDDDIFAYIKNENIASAQSFKNAGFIVSSDTVINGSQCITLKAVKNEHR